MKKIYFLTLMMFSFTLMNAQGGDTLTTPSGLKYIITRKGNGKKAATGDKIRAHYAGFLTNGTKFDASYDRNEPFSFDVGMGQVIAGWDEGFQILEEGGAATLIIPPSLGYGGEDMGTIPPNSTLVFNVELLDIFTRVNHEPFKTDGLPEWTSSNGLKMFKIYEPEGAVHVDSGDVVMAHYAGYLTDGKKFDASWDRNEPFEVTVKTGQVIKGFDQALMQMVNGGRYRITIPPQLGYGNRDVGNGLIPANSTLIFDLEILKINGVKAVLTEKNVANEKKAAAKPAAAKPKKK